VDALRDRAAVTNARHAPRVVELDPGSEGRWAAFVESHPDGLVFHHPSWTRTITRAHEYEFLGLASEDESGVLTGVLPLFEKCGLATGRRLSSLPHTPVAGPLATNDDAAMALVQAATDRARARGLSLELKLSSAKLGRVLPPAGFLPGGATYVLELPELVDDLRFGDSRNHSRIRWAVGKAGKESVRVREAQDERDLCEWYSLYATTVRWHGIPPRPYALFQAMWEILAPRGQMRLLLAERTAQAHRTLIAGSVLLMTARTVFYAFNGRDREHLRLRPNDLIQWHAIHDACRGGFRRYDMGEVTAGQGGLAEFKAKWGATEHRLYRYRDPAPPSRPARSLPAVMHRAGTAAWRRVPLPVTVRLGEWLYRRA
jgi:CelD/BcsL family acetyltransferase involved in cellulose biosynthesis